MAVDPHVREVLDAAARLDPRPLRAVPVDEGRARSEANAALRAGSVEVASVEDRRIPVAGGEIDVRVYRPDGGGPLPTVVFLHGGGWVLCSLETHDHLCRQLVDRGRCQVVSVGYRLAPEHRFPTPAEDAYAGLRWVADHADELGIDPTRLAVAGDSAGGNLAAVVALMARDRGGPPLALQLLIYPVTDAACDRPSMVENASGLLLETEDMRWFWDQYLSGPEDALHPYASPLRADDLSGLPPAVVVTAEHDPLRDEGEAYGRRLEEAGVPVEVVRYPGMVHGFISLAELVPRADEALADVGRHLRERLGGR